MEKLPLDALEEILLLSLPRSGLCGPGRTLARLGAVCSAFRRVVHSASVNFKRKVAAVSLCSWAAAPNNEPREPVRQAQVARALHTYAATFPTQCSFLGALDLSHVCVTQELLDWLPTAFPRLQELRLCSTLAQTHNQPLLLRPLRYLRNLDVSELVREHMAPVYLHSDEFPRTLVSFTRAGSGEVDAVSCTSSVEGPPLALEELDCPHLLHVEPRALVGRGLWNPRSLLGLCVAAPHSRSSI
jgi:hypothetical protein